MTGVPSQWSWVAIWADIRVVGSIALLSAVGLGLLYTACFGAMSAVDTLAALVARVVRSVVRQ